MTAAVLFDLDGTLVTLELDIEDVRLRLGALFAPHGVTRAFRPILRRIPEAVAEARTDDRDGLARAAWRILVDAELGGAREARPRPEAARAIRALRERGIPLGIVSNSGAACLPVALERAGLDPADFAVLFGREDVPAPKPDPRGIVAAAARLGGATWYVGDHPRDVEAARAAAALLPGLRVAALRGGLASDAELERAGADALLASLADVVTLQGIP